MANAYGRKEIGLLEAVSIGIGGMIGGGIFAVLGLTVLLAKGAAPIAFFIAGLIALITSYSYAKLSVRYPSEGGTIEYIVQAFGSGLIPSWLNTLLLASYVIMLALYAYAFGSYGAVLILGSEGLFVKKVLVVSIIMVFTLVNLMGAYIVGKAEDYMVVFKVLILLIFSAAGFLTLDPHRLSPFTYPGMLQVFSGGLIIFLAYEGFELIANTSAEVREPDITLPRAFFISVIFVIFIYVLVAIVAVGNLSYREIVKAQDYVLAEAARPFFGKTGFILISIAALLSTASAINATLFGTARVSYMVAKFGELPRVFAKKIWKGSYEGLVIISGITIAAALSFDLENISVAGSLGFLFIFGAINLANLKLAHKTGANRMIAATGALACIAAALVLVAHNMKTNPESLRSSLILIAFTFVFEVIYRLYRKKRLSPFIDWRLGEREEFLDNFERYLGDIMKAIQTRFAGSKVFLLDELARAKRDTANKLHLGVVVREPLAREERREEVERIRKEAGLKGHHPLKITFVKEEAGLRSHTPKEIRCEKGN